jgi:hypothetical protein
MGPPARALASVLVFPLILAGSIALALALMARVGTLAAVTLAETVAVLAIVAAERLLPYRPSCVWDLVFGTFFLPQGREPPSAIGIADLPGFPMRWGAQVLAPFRWARVRREAARA